MNNKLKIFLKEKKDLLIFIGVLVITFISVLGIASLANKPDEEEAGGNIDEQTPPIVDTPIEPQPKNPIFHLPMKDNYVVKRDFYDVDKDKEVLVNAVMTNGKTFIESTGVSFGKENNTVFDVYNVFPGEVVDVDGSTESIDGYKITIKHENGLVSVYSSLSNVNVNIGDRLSDNVKIGVSGTSIKDIAAGICVHLELLQDGNFINPLDAVGKEISEIVSVVK